MPSAESQPSTHCESLVTAQADVANGHSVMVQRGQQVAESRALFPSLQELLAGQIVVNAQSQERENLQLQKQLAQAVLIPLQLDTERNQLDAESAIALAALASKNAEAQLTQAAMSDFLNVMGELNSVTGSGPSTAPVSPTSSAGSPGLSYEGYKKAMDSINVFNARFGNLPGATDALREIDAKAAAITAAYGNHILGRVSEYHAAIASSTSIAGLLKISSDPQFQFAAHNPEWTTGLLDQYAARYAELVRQENEPSRPRVHRRRFWGLLRSKP